MRPIPSFRALVVPYLQWSSAAITEAGLATSSVYHDAPALVMPLTPTTPIPCISRYGLLSGVHYVSVEKATDVPAMVRWLQQHDDYARAVARAGRARMASLDVAEVSRRLMPRLHACFAPPLHPHPRRAICRLTLWPVARRALPHHPLSSALAAAAHGDCAGLKLPLDPAAGVREPSWI